MSNIKLKDHNWAAEGIYDTNQSKSQQTINSEVNTKVGQATLQTTSQNLSGATNELKGRTDTLDSKYDNVVTVSNTQPTSQYNKVWLPVTVGEGTSVPTWAEHQELSSAINAIHKVYYSVTEMGLTTSPKPTLASVANAMADGTMAVLNMNEVDESEMTTNLGLVNIILIYRVSSVRTFAFGARSYGAVNYNNARIFYGAYNTQSWFGWKEFDLVENMVTAITPSNITSGVSVTCRKKGSIVRLDCGIASGSKVSFASGTPTLAVLPTEARPPANVYFPIMIRFDGQTTFDTTPRYGIVYTNGNIALHSTGLSDVVQMVFGQTYFV